MVYVPPVPASIPELKVRIITDIETITADILLMQSYKGIGAGLSKVVSLAVNGMYCAQVKLSFYGVLKVR